MRLAWTSKALDDISRLHAFLAAVNKKAAATSIQTLVAAPDRLLKNPRIGERLEEFAPREVRKFVVGSYEIRYEIQETTLYVLRLWHTREDR